MEKTNGKKIPKRADAKKTDRAEKDLSSFFSSEPAERDIDDIADEHYERLFDEANGEKRKSQSPANQKTGRKEAEKGNPGAVPRDPVTGRFRKGNTVGMDTRIKPGEKAASKYKPEYADLMIEYFTNLNDENPFPTFELFAGNVLNVTADTLLHWKEEYAQFRNAYEICVSKQLGWAIRNGMTGLYDSRFARFYLSARHGMTEKTESRVDAAVGADVNLSQDKPFEVNITIVDEAK